MTALSFVQHIATPSIDAACLSNYPASSVIGDDDVSGDVYIDS